ncbi:MAG: carboxypeptidase-like regulatory domain-containing protein, partial [Tannerella sp.]|nr:carboxypeptidase-like regulatory domain-containing protein [Tannerella sp.]
MKRTGLILFLLLMMVSTVFAQTFRMEISNESLNRVLRTLDMEIAFDDQALSTYSVSVSRMFESKEKALLWLLNDIPFRVKKIESVYVIVPDNEKNPDHTNAVLQNSQEEQVTFMGTVLSQTTGEPLEYATVSLLNADNQPITSAITSDKGKFMIRTSRIPSKIKISYIGFETLLKDVHNLRGELGDFLLIETTILLDETIITANSTRHGINRSTYAVTQQMINNATNALELLDKIPGAYFDVMTKTLQLNNQSNILLLVDGIQQSQEYLKYLSPHRVQAIEIVYASSGRYLSDDYAGIIQFRLKKNYTGYNFFVSSASSLNLSKTAGSHGLSENHPAAGLFFSTRKLTVFGLYEYDRENRNMQSSTYLTYNLSDLTSIPSDHPNHLYQFENHLFRGGINYQLTPLHQVGIQADYATGNTRTFQKYSMKRAGLYGNTNQILTHATENLIHAKSMTGTFFYRGQVNNRFCLTGDFSYNFYY